jgi:hypothetical protein
VQNSIIYASAPVKALASNKNSAKRLMGFHAVKGAV